MTIQKVYSNHSNSEPTVCYHKSFVKFLKSLKVFLSYLCVEAQIYGKIHSDFQPWSHKNEINFRKQEK
jgi:hypothetical protein